MKPKRKYQFKDISIVLPSKRCKIISIKMTTKNEITYSEDEEIRSTFNIINEESNNELDSSFSSFTTIKSDDQETLGSNSENEGADIINDNMTVSSEEPNIDIQEMIPDKEDKWTKIGRQLSKMNRYDKGEAMEEQIKKQLEDYGFIVTKTQSTAKNGQIIGDNGVDHLAQIKISNQIIKLVIQSKNWKNEITGSVVRDLEGVLANQYPERIGLIITNNGGTNQRAKNLAKK